MKSAVETLDATTVKLTVDVSAEDLKPGIERAYAEIASEVAIPGFRKGKVPPRIIDQRFGRAVVVEQAVNDVLPTLYRQAVVEADLRPLGEPEISVTAMPVLTEPDGGLTFTAQVEVRPALDLPDLTKLQVTVDDVEVTEADVAERLDALRERFGTLVGVDRPAADGDYVVLDLRAEVDGEEVESVSGVSYRIGSGNLLPGLDDALAGLSAEETTSFEAPLAGGEHAGKDAVVTVTPTAVKERELPEADDDFAQLASEFDTLAELQAELREQVAGIKARNQAVQARQRLLAELRERVEIPLPQGVVDAEVNRHLESEGRLADDEHRAEVLAETRESVLNQILLDTLAEQFAVQVGQEELLQYLVGMAGQYGMDPNEFISQVDQRGQIPAMIAEVAQSKASARALRQVKVVTASGAAVDLAPYLGEESDDDDAAAGEAVAGGGADPAGAEEPAAAKDADTKA